jgi:hypothetical protein
LGDPQPAASQASRNPRTERPWRRQGHAVKSQHGLDPPHRARQEDLTTAKAQQGQRFLANLDADAAGGLDRSPASDAGQDATVGRGRAQPVVADGEEAGARGLEGGAILIDEQR